MHALVVTLLFTTAAVRTVADDTTSFEVAGFARNRCIGAGAAGAAAGALGLVVGGGLALGIAEIVKAADPANTSASQQFASVAVPLAALAGGFFGLAAGMIGAWELGEELAERPPVTR